jgi:hypothetical protein
MWMENGTERICDWHSWQKGFQNQEGTPMKTIAMIALVTLCCSTIALSQTETGTILGRITDPSGAAISGADIQVQNVLTGAELRTKTNSSGLYVATALPPGTYRIIVSNPGFRQIVKPDVILNVQGNISLNFTMTVGSTSEIVTVTGGAPLVNSQDASIGTVVDHNFAQNMPLNGRSIQSLMELTPGVTLAPTSYLSQGQLTTAGQRSDANYFTVDGVSANFAVNQGDDQGINETAAGALPAVTTTGGTNGLVSVDAVQEFKIQTSTFAPEFGRSPGAQLSIVTRSGTNQFHGTAFEYLRNGIFDAPSWFVGYSHLTKPIIKQNDFGGVFGGPILKDRLFFFFSYEGLRLRQPNDKIEVEPSLAARSQAPASMKPLLNAFPVPTSPTSNPLLGLFAGSWTDPSTLNAVSLRGDYTPTSKVSIFGRYNHAPSNTTARGAASFYALSTLAYVTANVDTFTAGATVTFKPNLVDEFRFNFSRATSVNDSLADNFGGAVVPPLSYMFQGAPQGNLKNYALGAIFLPDFNGYFYGPYSPLARQQQLNFVDSLAWNVGRHAIKAGFDYRRLTPIEGSGTYPYISLPFFAGIQGALSSTPYFSEIIAYGLTVVRPLVQNLSFYGQDTWQATPNLTLCYGLRWEYNPPPYGTNYPLYTVINLNDPANAAFAPAGTPLWNATYDNFAPRLGIAYSLRRNSERELVLRGGAGIFYDLGNNTAINTAYSPPYSQTKYLSNAPFPFSTADATPLPFTLNPPFGRARGFDRNLQLPRTYQWNVSLQQAFGSRQSVSLTYLGSAGRDLLRDELLTPGLPALNLNPNFAGGVVATTNSDYSNYNALQLQYQWRQSHGLEVLASYSWAHATDNGSSQSTVTPWHTIYNPDIDYASADFDTRQSFSTAMTYSVPSLSKSGLVHAIASNWAFDSLFRVYTALPINVLSGNDPWSIGALIFAENPYQRPDVVPNQPFFLYGSQYPGGKAINKAAFTNPPTGSQGDLGRNALRGFGAWEEDLAIRREFPIHEQVNLQFRAEFFNIFNHPNFGNPGTQSTGTNSIQNPLFGLSTSTLAQSFDAGAGTGSFSTLYNIGGPRSVQFALKLTF